MIGGGVESAGSSWGGLPPGTVAAALRALILGVGLAGIAPQVARALRHRRWLWVVVLLPLVTPSVVVGYAYLVPVSSFSAAWTTELVYAGLVAARLLPVAVVLEVVLPPPPLSAAAAHCGALAGGLSWRGRMWGRWRNRAVVAGLTFVLAFQEFELASLFFGVRAWTVSVFDLQAGGSRLTETLAAVAPPLAIEIAVLLGIALWFHRTRSASTAVSGAGQAGGVGWIWPVLGTGAMVVVPGVLLLPRIVDIPGQMPIVTDVGHSFVLALGGALVAGVIGLRCPLRVLVFLAVPGLVGGLILGLLLVAVFQVPGLRWGYDTPLPVLTGFVLLLLPMVLVLRLALERRSPSANLHLASMLEGSSAAEQRRSGGQLWFTLRGQGLALAGLLLFTTAFFEVVAADLLAPTNMMPAAPRLYNLLHYGRSPGLAAMTLILVGSVVVFAAGVLGVWTLIGYRRFHPVRHRARRP